MKKYAVVDKYFDGYNLRRGSIIFTVNDGIITSEHVANDAEIKSLIADNNEVVDLRGNFVSPGLIDSHDHFMLTALKMKYQVDFSGIRSFDDFRKILEDNKNKVVHGWFQGYGINEYNMEEKRLPDLKVIDEIFGNVPLFITHMTEHYGMCNSKALEMAGIDRETESPPNSRIGRENSGNPNGVLYEAKAMDLIKRKIPEYNVDDYMEAIKFGSDHYRNAGLATVKDTGGTGNDVNEETRINAINRLSRNGDVGIRMAIALPVYSIEDVGRKIELAKMIHENSNIKFAGFKMFLDGSILSRTAWMKNGYVGSKNNKGIPLWEIHNFKEALRRLATTGYHISIHTIGDRAIDTALDAIEELKNAGIGSRYALVHCYKLNRETIQRIKRLNAGIETQLAFIYFIGDALSDNMGRKQSRCLFPIKTMIEQGIAVSNGSDSPVTPFNPLYGIYSSMFRETLTGRNSGVYDDRESISLEGAIKTYTSESAKVIQWDEIGSLERGKNADFTVWSEDPENLKNNINEWLGITLKSITLR